MERKESTVVFLRTAVIELRQLAETTSEIREPLLHIAKQLEAEADDLAANPQP
jgi:hypothetical protein